MPNEHFRKWYLSGLQALRSASEQGAQAGKELQAKADDADLKAAVARYGSLAAEHHAAIIGFLAEINQEPNSFKDRIMEGVSNGTIEMLRAAEDARIIDLAVLSGTGSGADYYANAFGGQTATAQALWLSGQAGQWKSMATQWSAF